MKGRLAEIFQDPDSRVAFAKEKFRAISGRYDLLIKLLSLGLDGRWRGLTISKAALPPGGRGLDVATGTGDLALRMARAGVRAVGVDLSLDMLLVARKRGAGGPNGPSLCLQRAEALAFGDNIFDACTMGVALRHMRDLRGALNEMARVVRPGGRVVIADYSVPRGGLSGRLYRLYFFHLMPVLGWLLTFDRNIYSLLKYLPISIVKFLPPEAISGVMREVGLVNVDANPLARGAVWIYAGVKAGAFPPHQRSEKYAGPS